jgi:hypothetical protein
MLRRRPISRFLGAVLLALAALLPSVALAAGPFPVGTRASTVNLSAAPDAVPYGLGWAIPLRGARPAWYTPGVEQTVLAAAGTPVAAPNDAPLPSAVGIRPGAWMIAPNGCTMNFVFAQGADLAIGTAGHCAEVGESVVLLTLAPGGADPVLVDIGTVLVSHDNGVGDDFALVSIRPELHSWVNATTAVIGGPCGQYAGSGPAVVMHYGHGLAIGTGGTPRAGLALTWQAESFGWNSPSIFGDSGSPVRVADLKAAGDLTHLVVDPAWLPSFVAGTRIGKMLQIAGGWSLRNSTLCS